MKKWFLPLALVLVAGAIGVLGTVIGWDKAGAAVRRISSAVSPDKPHPAPRGPNLGPISPSRSWDGRIHLEERQIAAIGVQWTKAEAQTESTYLEVTGTTAYDPRTLSPIRSRFECLVSKVYVSVGDLVRKGDPLLDLFSTDLAEAKSRYEERLAQWDHDNAQLARLKPLFEQKAVSEKDYYDALNDERKSRLEYKVARDNLGVFGLSDDEIANIAKEDGAHKAMLTLHSPVSGVVIIRDVVEGSLYDPSDKLLTIAPPDKLWVLGNVYESDQDRVHVGQPWEIRFPFLTDVITTTVEHVDARVNPTTKTVQIRTTIANPGGRFKADMLVRGQVAIPPVPGRTVIPRQAVVVQDAAAFVFVQDPKQPGSFLRREVEIGQEFQDKVLVARGLEPGEVVVTRGSLILSQIYEDLSVTETGLPL